MNHTLNFPAYKNRKHFHRAQRWIAGFLACIVGFSVTFSLIQPASTMERSCTIEEHQHGDGCYTRQTTEDVTALTCGFAAHVHEAACGDSCGYADFAVHSHSDLCYDGDALVCALPEILPHTHDESCYSPAHTHTDECYVTVLGALVCELESREPHFHGDGCYLPMPVCTPEDPDSHVHEDSCFASTLVCALEETEGHIHSEECHIPLQSLICTEDTETLVLVCGLPEITLHTHTEECFATQDAEQVLTCPLTEVLRHDHDESCVTVTTVPADVQVLTCTIPEHTHSDACSQASTEPAETLPAETLPAETLPAETQPVEAQPVETQPVESQPVESQPVESQPQSGFFALRPTTVVDSGTFLSTEGNELSWELIKYTLTGEHTLTISGEGTMPAFTEGGAPWYKHNSTPATLVLEDGLLNVSSNAFYKMNLTSISFSNTIKSIDSVAFIQCNGLTSLDIPASVETVGYRAFYQTHTTSFLTLHEGLRFIEADAFSQGIPGYYTNIYIPASVESIGSGAFGLATSYEVDPDSQHYSSIDGVLYSYDKKTLVDFPKFRTLETFAVPDGVTTILSGALSGVSNVRNLYIPASVQYSPRNFCLNSSYYSIYIEDGAVPGENGSISQAFYFNTSLQEVRLPGNAPFEIGDTFTHCSALRHIEIPAGTRQINTPGSYISALESLRYNARNAGMQDRDMLDNTPAFALTIGKDVDNLSYVFHEFTEHALSIQFEASNYITIDHDITANIEERAFQDAPAPFQGLSGSIYIDAQGVVYTLDNETHTASVYCVQPGAVSVTIPASISAETGDEVYTVTSIRTDALKYAGNLQAISFDDPNVITDLQALALANCPSLTQVGDATTVEDAAALFPNATLGYNIFFNTGLTDAPGTGNFSQEMAGSNILAVEGQGATRLDITIVGENLGWTQTGEKTGGYRMLTGQTATISASVGNTEEGQESLYRVYFRSTSSDISLSLVPGKSESFNNWEVKYFATEDPYTVYAEFGAPPEGNTSGIPLTANYPNGTSGGGGLTVWGMIVDGNAAPGLLEPESPQKTIQFWWDTQADDFTVTTVPTQTGTIGVTFDKTETPQPSANLGWKTTLTRVTDNSSPFGKDYLHRADIVDTFTLPTGVQWKPEVLDAIKNGLVTTLGNYLYADDLLIGEFSASGTDLIFRDKRIAMDAQTATFGCSIINAKTDAEMNTATITIVVYASALQIDPTTFDTTKPTYFTNEASATLDYTYRDNAAYTVDPETGAVTNPHLYASATRAISGGTGVFAMKQTCTAVQYFGEDITYTNRVYNHGALPWTGSEISDTSGYILRDLLPKEVWIKPENMERMFEEEPSLTITIEGAVLGPWKTATGVDGTEVDLHPGNSDIGTTDHTLTITYSDGVYQVAVTGGSTYTGESLSQVLENAGYAVTATAKYTCLWPMNAPGEAFTLQGGENRYFYIYATAKNTFQMIQADWPEQYDTTTPLHFYSISYMMRPNSSQWLAHQTASSYLTRDCAITMDVFRDGEILEANQSINDGTQLEYRLALTHYGSGEPQDLPFVDYLYGSQYLLVPKDLNPGLSGLETHGDYYILAEGTYENIIVGMDEDNKPLTAASIIVRPAQENESIAINGSGVGISGLLTQIHWIYPSLPAGFHRMQISYPALVDLDLTGVDYTIGNIISLNNRTDAHLYDTLLGGGTLLDFSLDILETPGDDPAADVADEDGYTLIGPGEAVNYRATISSNRQDPVSLYGDKLAISLPDTFGLFDWELGVNVTDLRIVTEDGVTFTGSDSASIGTGYGKSEDDLPYILWPASSLAQFEQPSSLYIYFTLTYPSDIQTYARTSSGSLWDRYADALRGDSPKIGLYLYNYPSTVGHDLKEPGAVLLQKGVLGTYLYQDRQAIKPSSSRLYFNNKDTWERAITYYVVLYNGENKRFYLDDLYDQLPDGFSFLTMLNSDGKIPPISTLSMAIPDGGSSLVDVADPNVSFRSAVVTADTAHGLTFRISAGTGDNALRYDQQKQKYYLEQGEAVAFGYACSIGLASETQDKASSEITMAYDDYTGTGVILLSQQEIAVRAPMSTQFPDDNNGTRFSVTEANEESNISLISQVSLHRGNIVPGLTKVTESYQSDIGADATTYVNQVPHNAIVNWRMRLYNSGTLAMTDYTLTDVMPYPYSFVGTVFYGLPEDGETTPSPLFSIPRHTPVENMSLTVTDLSVSTPRTHTLVIGGAPVKMGITDKEFYVSLSLDERGNEVLSIRFAGLYRTISEGSYMNVALSGVNTTGSYTYSVYTNQAYLIPSQEFSSISQGSMVRNAEGLPIAARDADSVTVSIGFATRSESIATQDERTASSAGEGRNFTVLEEDDPNFSYTLQVDNDTDHAMTKLVLIDNLPEVGDHNPFDTSTDRGSEFTVSLAGEPNFRVMIHPENGEPYAAVNYTIQYSTGTDFGKPQSTHWQGQAPNADDPTQWTDDPTGARSFRVILGESIPPKASVKVTFDAVAPHALQPGQAAWNSFGYHYALEGEPMELEAMAPVVGVKSPSIPALRKQVLDINGSPALLQKDVAFSFVVFEGSLPGDEFTTTAELAQLLDAAGKAYRTFSLSMEAGSSLSDYMDLRFDGWNWKEGQTYSLVEILEDDAFSFRKFLGTGAASYTFTYDPGVQQQILCENTMNHWSVELSKTDPTGKGLEDGVFGLYSPNAADQISGEAFNAPEQLTYNGITWYLSHIGTTDKNGCILWDQLERSSYYLLEIQPPPGHVMGDQPGQLLYRSAAEEGVYRVSMVNQPGYALPHTGSIGTAPLTIPGLLLMAAAVIAFFSKKKLSY